MLEHPVTDLPPHSNPGFGAPPAPRRRTLLISLVAVGALLITGLGAGLALLTREVVSAAAPGLSTVLAEQYTVVVPDPLGGRSMQSDAEADTMLALALSSQPGTEHLPTAAAVYADAAGGHDLLLHAHAGILTDPQGVFEHIFFNLRAVGIPVFEVTEVAPGPLGGLASCGTAKLDGKVLPVCGWADDHTYGYFIWYSSSLEAARAEFAELRGQVEIPM